MKLVNLILKLYVNEWIDLILLISILGCIKDFLFLENFLERFLLVLYEEF